MRLHAPAAIVVMFGLLSGAAVSAQELTLGLNSEFGYDSNFLGLQENEEPSVRVQTGPRATIRDSEGRLTYDLEYRGYYVWFIEPWDPGLNDWQQNVRLSSSYALSRTTSVSVTDIFRDVSSVRFTDEESDDDTDTLDGGRDQFFRNAFGFELDHSFSPRLVGTLSGQHDWIGYQDNLSNSDSISMTLSGRLSYSVTRADRIGAGGGFSYQAFDARDRGVPGSRGRTWNISANWLHRFEEDFRIELSGGPTFIQTASSNDVPVQSIGFRSDDMGGVEFVDSDSCVVDPALPEGFFFESNCPGFTAGVPQTSVVNVPFLDGSDEQNDFTFFARASAVRRWIDWEFRALYQRSQSNAAGDGGTSTLDRVQLRVSYDADRLWQFYGSVGWNRRVRATRPIQIADFVVIDGAPGNPGFAERVAAVESRGTRKNNTNQISFLAGSRRRFTRQLTGTFEFRYRYQRRSRSSGGASTSNRNTNFILLSARIDYGLAPIYF